MVSERALNIWLQQDVLHDALKEDIDRWYPMIAEPIYRNGKRHWSGVVHDTNDRALEALRSLDPDLFDLHCTAAVGSAEDEQLEVMATRDEKWAKVEEMARANALVSPRAERRDVRVPCTRMLSPPCARVHLVFVPGGRLLAGPSAVRDPLGCPRCRQTGFFRRHRPGVGANGMPGHFYEGREHQPEPARVEASPQAEERRRIQCGAKLGGYCRCCGRC